MKFKLLILCCLLFTRTNLWAFSTIGNAYSIPNVWDVLRSQFALNHETNRPEVQSQIRWILSHPGYIQKLARQSEPYIYHILTEIKKRHLPGEIALVPMIESSYNPFAYSGAGAAGLWQIMPGTGMDLGLKQDWWLDGRRSIRSSTEAALNYLTYLNNFFSGDWILAFAAYDAGENGIARIIKNSPYTGRKASFWVLNVPEETRAYVPRLLAIAEIVQNPQRYGIKLPHIPHIPYFAEINIGSQIDLNHAAKLAGMSYKDLIKLNPGFNRWATAPYSPYKLLIPVGKAEHFSRNLANVPIDKRVSWTRHKVSPGDNLIFIAKKYHTTVNLIKELNQLKSMSVTPGQYVLIPSSNTAAQIRPLPLVYVPSHFINVKEYKMIHIVQNDESYQHLQTKYGVSAHEIQAWNTLDANTPLYVGQQLIIWKRSTMTSSYIVKKGETIAAIAKQNNTSLNTLIKLNPTLRNYPVRAGQKINLG